MWLGFDLEFGLRRATLTLPLSATRLLGHGLGLRVGVRVRARVRVGVRVRVCFRFRGWV